MMGARTASAQLGYVFGAAGGGLVLAVSDFGTMGFVLFAGMAAAAFLLARVSDPEADETGGCGRRSSAGRRLAYPRRPVGAAAHR